MLHAVLLTPGRWVTVGTNTFGISVPMGTPHAGARSIPVGNNLYDFLFLCRLSKRETRKHNACLPLLRCETHVL
jgi:hypothetical protein